MPRDPLPVIRSMIPHLGITGAGADRAFSGLLGSTVPSPCVVIVNGRSVPGSNALLVRDLDITRVRTASGVVAMPLAHLVCAAYRAYDPSAETFGALSVAVSRVSSDSFQADIHGDFLRVPCRYVGEGMEATLDVCQEHNRTVGRPEITCEVDGQVTDPGRAKSLVSAGLMVSRWWVMQAESLPRAGGYFRSLGLVPDISLAEVRGWAEGLRQIDDTIDLPYDLALVADDDLWRAAMDRCLLPDRHALRQADGSIDAVMAALDDPDLAMALSRAFTGREPFPDPWGGALVLDVAGAPPGKVALVLSVLSDARLASGSLGVTKYVFVDPSLAEGLDAVVSDAWAHLLRVGRKLGITVVQVVEASPGAVVSLTGPRVTAAADLSSVHLDTDGSGSALIDLHPWMDATSIARGESLRLGYTRDAANMA
jgi:hypothetical protein